MPFDFTALATTPAVRGLPSWQVRLVTAFRVGTMASQVRGDASPRLALLLGGEDRLHPFRIFVAELGASWPEPFAVNPPCCPHLSFDEALMLAAAAGALAGDHPAFHARLADMLPSFQRGNLWRVSRRLLSGMLNADC